MSDFTRFRHKNVTYFYHVEKPLLYWFDKANAIHVIIYDCVEYSGAKNVVEWRIPGTIDRDITYAKRLSQKLLPSSIVSQAESLTYWTENVYGENKRNGFDGRKNV